MARVVQARLDDDTERMLDELRRRTRLSDSELVRRGIRSLAVLPPSGRGPKVIGVGRFASGVRDLGSNKTHLKGFGRR
jgi:ribbon-helix-helix CopG family protein